MSCTYLFAYKVEHIREEAEQEQGSFIFLYLVACEGQNPYQNATAHQGYPVGDGYLFYLHGMDDGTCTQDTCYIEHVATYYIAHV